MNTPGAGQGAIRNVLIDRLPQPEAGILEDVLAFQIATVATEVSPDANDRRIYCVGQEGGIERVMVVVGDQEVAAQRHVLDKRDRVVACLQVGRLIPINRHEQPEEFEAAVFAPVPPRPIVDSRQQELSDPKDLNDQSRILALVLGLIHASMLRAIEAPDRATHRSAMIDTKILFDLVGSPTYEIDMLHRPLDAKDVIFHLAQGGRGTKHKSLSGDEASMWVDSMGNSITKGWVWRDSIGRKLQKDLTIYRRPKTGKKSPPTDAATASTKPTPPITPPNAGAAAETPAETPPAADTKNEEKRPAPVPVLETQFFIAGDLYEKLGGPESTVHYGDKLAWIQQACSREKSGETIDRIRKLKPVEVKRLILESVKDYMYELGGKLAQAIADSQQLKEYAAIKDLIAASVKMTEVAAADNGFVRLKGLQLPHEQVSNIVEAFANLRFIAVNHPQGRKGQEPRAAKDLGDTVAGLLELAYQAMPEQLSLQLSNDSPA